MPRLRDNPTVRTITESELRADVTAVLDAVESGEVYRISREGRDIAELRPVSRRRRTAMELVERHRALPAVDHGLMRQQADEFFDP